MSALKSQLATLSSAIFCLIVEYGVSKLGCGYIYGATGWICTVARRQQQAAQYPEYAEMILGRLGAQWDGMQCFDCAQLVRQAVAAAGGYLPSGATSQWNYANGWMDKGTMDTFPNIPGVVLYRQSNERMQHTGLYVGSQECIDARGTAVGVIRSKLSSYPWTHWALPRIDERKGGQASMVTTAVVWADSGTTVNLRNSPTSDIVRARVPVGATVDVIELGEAHCTVVYDGSTGTMPTRFLRFADGAQLPVDTQPGSSPNTGELEGIYEDLTTLCLRLGQHLGKA